MNLKLVVASMSVLGLVTCPAFATQTQTKHHHRHHKAKPVVHRDYKGMVPAPVEVCTISNATLIMDKTTQNEGRALPNPCNPGWFNRIALSGGVNVDFGKWGNRNGNYMGENYKRISLNDVYLNLSAVVNDWSKAFVSIDYATPTTNENPSEFNYRGAAEYDAAYANNINGSAANLVQVEQAYATFGNFDVSPIFVQVGKQFADFSSYDIHPVTTTLTQDISEVLATQLKIGFIANGFHGSLYAFDDPTAKIGSSATPTNYGIALGYDQICDTFGWDVGAAYLYNLIGVNDTAYSINNFTGGLGYHNRVGGYALYGDFNTGPFSIGLRFTSAAQRFNVNDLTKNGFADLTAASAILGSGFQVTPHGTATGAKPWAAGIQAGYNFNVWDKNQNVYLGYQASREAAGLNLPRGRWEAGYGIAMWKNTDFGLVWDHDQAYSKSNGGTSNTTNLVSIRAAVKFA